MINGKNSKIYIAGATGMVGGAVKRRLTAKGYTNLISRTSAELNLIEQSAVREFFAAEKPEIVLLCAGKVGGILANDTFRAEFIYNNLLIEANVIDAARRENARKLIFLGSSCIYPKFAAQPIIEEELLAGKLESTNEPYALAKIAGIKLCESYHRQYGCDFYSAMPTNLYGAHDNFDLQTSHVIPALLRRFHEARTSDAPRVDLWGTGAPRREFLYVEDLADAIVFLMENVSAEAVYAQNISQINIGTGADITIGELAGMISNLVGYRGEIAFDAAKPDGTPRKLLDVSRINRLGWTHSTALEDGLRRTYEWFCANRNAVRAV